MSFGSPSNPKTRRHKITETSGSHPLTDPPAMTDLCSLDSPPSKVSNKQNT